MQSIDMPAKYEQINIKTALGNLSFLGTRFWTRHCFDPYTNCGINCTYCNTGTARHIAQLETATPICAKINAPKVLARELSGLKLKGIVSVGLAMDAYQPLEKELCLTRKVLEVLNKYNCPFSIGTKSDLVLRDLDIISEAAKKMPCCVSLSITTLDEKLAKLLEPNASTPKKRLEAVKQLSNAGVTTGVWLSPILPYITDTEENIASIIEAAVENGASVILGGALDTRSPIGLYKFLNAHYPKLVEKYDRLYKRADGSYQYYPREAYLYPLCKRFINICKKYHVRHYMPHLHTRKQALLFYIKNYALTEASPSELLAMLNYMPLTQEILQTINLRFGNNTFSKAFLTNFRYFPH
jgi:DNA repair photolyase